MRKRGVLYLILIVLLLLVAACGGGDAEEPTADSQDTDTTETTEPTPDGGQTDTTPPDNPVSFYMIAEAGAENGIEVGCGDVLAPVPSDVNATGVLRSDVQAALTALANATNDTAEGFTSALEGLGLRVLNVTINSGTSATINIMGNVRFGTDRCLAARMEAQIVLTIMQFEDLDRAQIALAGRNMRQVFSNRSDLSLASAYGRDDYLDIINENSGAGAADSGGDEEMDATDEAEDVEDEEMDATDEAEGAEDTDDAADEEMDATAEPTEEAS